MRFWLLIIFAVLLQSCASPKYSQEVQQGKLYFEAGNFKKAMHALLPPAVAGNPRAQYAIGYMYYYGYGAHQDDESGLFWMSRAADNHYPPAIKAVNQIRMANSAPEEMKAEGCELNAREAEFTRRDVKAEKDEVLRSISRPISLETKTPKKIKEESVAENEKKNEQTPKATIQAEGYGLQLMGAYDLEDAKKYQQSLGVQKTSVIWHAEHNNKDWFVLIYGHYPTIAEAREAMMHLPKNLRDMGPWVRELKGLG